MVAGALRITIGKPPDGGGDGPAGERDESTAACAVRILYGHGFFHGSLSLCAEPCLLNHGAPGLRAPCTGAPAPLVVLAPSASSPRPVPAGLERLHVERLEVGGWGWGTSSHSRIDTR
eukprot:scaffold10944_cov28-Tisochrysis_lutea.AAC.6